MLSAGIVGLPNVGKSTLFKAITNTQVLIENYPFATIKPNIGVCSVNDERLAKIASIFKPNAIFPTTLELHDIAGLVKGASKGQGLGNQFLANIRNTDAICEVIRCFENNDIVHVEQRVDPVADFEIIELELILADQQLIKNRLERLTKKAKVGLSKEAIFEIALLKQINQNLEQFVPLREQKFNDEEQLLVQSLNFLTYKPLIIIANVNEADLTNPDNNSHLGQLKTFAANKNIEVVVICAQVESEIAELTNYQRQEFLDMLNVKISGVDQIVLAAYKLLNLATFFTAGVKEVRAWTFNKGMTAPECAGKIHSDMQRGFIRAEVYHYDDLITCSSEKKVKEEGKLRIEGKNYLMKDGDICYFRFNV